MNIFHQNNPQTSQSRRCIFHKVGVSPKIWSVSVVPCIMIVIHMIITLNHDILIVFIFTSTDVVQCTNEWQWQDILSPYGCLSYINTLRTRQNGLHFADDIFNCIFMHENVWISLKVSLKFVPKFPINNIPAMVQMMAWRRPGDKPLFEPMMVNSMTHICVTRPQWVNITKYVLRLTNVIINIQDRTRWKRYVCFAYILSRVRQQCVFSPLWLGLYMCVNWASVFLSVI